MSGNNMSRMMSNEEYDNLIKWDYEEEYPLEEEYEDVYDYENECKMRKMIYHLECAREHAIHATAYPELFSAQQPNRVDDPMRVYIKSENLQFIRNKKHVHFDMFGCPY